MVQESYIVSVGAPGLAMICATLLTLGFVEDKQAGATLMKSTTVASAVVLRFAGCRAVADVDPQGRASLTIDASSAAQLAPVVRLLSEQPVPGTRRPIAALLKSKAQARREAAQQRQQAQAQAAARAATPTREAAARAAARQEANWRCRLPDLAGIESRLMAIGAQSVPGADGLPVWQINGDTEVSLRQSAAGAFGTVQLVGYRPADFSTAVRVITANPAEQLTVTQPSLVEARPVRVKKSRANVADMVLAASDHQLTDVLGRLPPSRRNALRESLKRR